MVVPTIHEMPNRLAAATSPYLLQHRDNPVDWWEWGDGAFDAARERQVPVLLSVGYSACHWCHVMAHESFEDPATADLMNENFVNIKVDREERPDVDSIYMEAVQAMTGRGGWPMTVWMTPDARPFYAGTYFPSEPHAGMPAFREVLQALSAAWKSSPEDVFAQADKLVAAISREVPSGDLPGTARLDGAVAAILGQFDPAFGGFGGAPKFPQQPVLEFLLRSRDANPEVGAALIATLDAMAAGGIHDHLGGGFARYSVDREWLVPHFEKMLYDNAQLARIYLWAGIELGQGRLLDVTATTIDYVVNELRHQGGGFFSAEDADSEGVEGKFYLWDRDEFDQVLGPDADMAADYFDVTTEGNYEGSNILNLRHQKPAPANLDEIRAKLLRHRSRRVRPGLDDKVVAAWNGLTIRALAEAGAALDNTEYITIAEQAADFLVENLYVDGILMRSWRDGRTSVPGFVDDHAAVALGLFALYQASGHTHWHAKADELVAGLDGFEAPEGGFYTTASDQSDLIKRPHDMTDSPSPSGNALAAEALLISSLFTGDHSRRDRAAAALARAGALVDRYPSMIGHHLAVARSIDIGTKEIAIVGEPHADLVRVFWSRFRPHMALAQAPQASADIPLLTDRAAIASKATAYVCQGFVCNLPTDSPDELSIQLDSGTQSLT